MIDNSKAPFTAETADLITKSIDNVVVGHVWQIGHEDGYKAGWMHRGNQISANRTLSYVITALLFTFVGVWLQSPVAKELFQSFFFAQVQ
jgi:hypothetical protein